MKLFILFLILSAFIACNKTDNSGSKPEILPNYDYGLIRYWVDSALGSHWYVLGPGPILLNDSLVVSDSARYRNDTLQPKLHFLYNRTNINHVEVWMLNVKYDFSDIELRYLR